MYANDDFGLRDLILVYFTILFLYWCYNRNGQYFTLITKFNLLAQVVQKSEKLGSATH